MFPAITMPPKRWRMTPGCWLVVSLVLLGAAAAGYLTWHLVGAPRAAGHPPRQRPDAVR